MAYANIKNGQQQQKGKIPAKLADKIPSNKICAVIIVTYKIRRKRKESLALKAVTIINPVIRWF